MSTIKEMSKIKPTRNSGFFIWQFRETLYVSNMINEQSGSAEERMKKTFFAVEANSFELTTLWNKNAHDGYERGDNKGVQWDQISNGWGVHVGNIGDNKLDLQVWMRVNWARIEGKLVLFWYPSGNYVDYKLCEAWIEKYISNPNDAKHHTLNSYASNFHKCLNAIKESNESTQSETKSIVCDRLKNSKTGEPLVIETKLPPATVDNIMAAGRAAGVRLKGAFDYLTTNKW